MLYCVFSLGKGETVIYPSIEKDTITHGTYLSSEEIKVAFQNKNKNKNRLVLWNKMVSKTLLKNIMYVCTIQNDRYWWGMRTIDGDHGHYGDKPQPIKMLSCTTKFQQLHLQKTPTPKTQETFQKRQRKGWKARGWGNFL